MHPGLQDLQGHASWPTRGRSSGGASLKTFLYLTKEWEEAFCRVGGDAVAILPL